MDARPTLSRSVDKREDFLQVFFRHFFLLGKEGKHRFERVAEEGAFHFFHDSSGIFFAADERIKHEGFASPFLLPRLDETFVGQYLQKRGNGGVSWLGLWIVLDDLMRSIIFRFCIF